VIERSFALSKNHREVVEKWIAKVESDRQRPVEQSDVDRLLADYESPDEQVRAEALKQSCPCHVPWEVYAQLRKPALRLRRDPSALVRRLANHLEEDARVVAQMEADRARYIERDEEMAERARKRARQRTRSGKRSVRFAGSSDGAPR
jgi:hypothetical protein